MPIYPALGPGSANAVSLFEVGDTLRVSHHAENGRYNDILINEGRKSDGFDAPEICFSCVVASIL